MRGVGAGGRVLVTGAAGMLGSELCLRAPAGFEPLGTDLVPARPGTPPVSEVGCDLADPDAVAELFRRAGPFVGVLHAAAYTAVDKAEEEEDAARRANALAPEVLARACADARIPLVAVGTDFVFDGAATKPYPVDAPPRPLGAYGRTKLEGEERARAAWPAGTRVVRTQWLYGPRGRHFPGTILRLAEERDQLQVVDDQKGSPTTTLELAPALWDVLRHGEAGIYHAACDGECSWFDLARATLELAGRTTKVVPCSTSEFPRPAPRPAYSVLDCSKLTALRGRPMAPWRQALADFMAHETRAGAPGGRTA